MKTIYKTLLSWIKSDTNFADYKLSSDALRLVKWKNHETKDLDLSLDERLKLVKVINKRAFKGCSNLTSIIIPSGVTSIESEAFKGCSSLTSISIPDSVTSIEESAFEGCSSLTSISIPDSVTSIGYGAFQVCGLTSVSIPNSVTRIEGGDFCSLSKLDEC